MTRWIPGTEVADRLRAVFPDAVVRADGVGCEVTPESLLAVSTYLRDDRSFAVEQATNVTSVDWEDDFEVVYHLQSITRNEILTLKCRPRDREDPIVPSVSPVWKGAWLQEMEVYDMMGIRFEGHPNLRRLFLWEGYSGWPLRKDFVQVKMGDYHPGLPHFPKQGGTEGVLNGPRWAAIPPAQRKADANDAPN